MLDIIYLTWFIKIANELMSKTCEFQNLKFEVC